MIMAALIVISLVVVLAQVRETCVSGNTLGPSVGGELDLPGVHSALTFSCVSWGWEERILNGKPLSLIPLLSPGSSTYSWGLFFCLEKEN